MSNLRFDAIKRAHHRPQIDVKLPAAKISDFFAENLFTIETTRQYLPKSVFKSLVRSIEEGGKIDRNIADQVASAMKAWAIGKGATSYTHWFQPLTGATAEKHDTFFQPITNSTGIENFSGSQLVQQEPDGSSFPSGGLRATFEARGYTAWDPSSPAFIMTVGSSGKTLCIPTIFVSYTGEALDYKAPLLKSQHFVETAAVAVANFFDEGVKRVVPTLGWEQEYFLVDASLYYARPDLVAAGRTLLGSRPPKGQQLDDHYFGSIAERVYAYMLDFETEALKLGITISTRHNEVAPSQYECAPVFTNVNVAVDQNQLLMDVMDRVARRHHLRVLFHEKPYAGVNGSGKHNNWSLQTDGGTNLLAPGNSPKSNLQFITFFVNVVKAVHEHADLLRAAIATAGNDHRLGANEAPPAIISVFIGSALTKILDDLEVKVSKTMNEMDKEEIKLDIHKQIPDLLMDNTDRNRTSPFAFTGNKFEFRAVGSSANCASSMIVLNTIIAQQLAAYKKDVDALLAEGVTKEGAILRVLRRYIKASKAIRFEGDNYTDDWAAEAEKRGLANIKNTPEALDAFISDKTNRLFIDNDIYTKRELDAYHEVLLENYLMKIDIESRILNEMVLNQVLPASLRYQKMVMDNIKTALAIGLSKKELSAQYSLARNLNEHINGLQSATNEMILIREEADTLAHHRERAVKYYYSVTPYFTTIRKHADALELLVDNGLWPLPKYRELLFIR